MFGEPTPAANPSAGWQSTKTDVLVCLAHKTWNSGVSFESMSELVPAVFFAVSLGRISAF